MLFADEEILSVSKAITQMEERGMQNDPRYQQLMAMANRTKQQQQQGMGGPQASKHKFQNQHAIQPSKILFTGI